MQLYAEKLQYLQAKPRKWLITGVAGFIGSSLLKLLLQNDQIVVGLDNFSTGFRRNLDEIKTQTSEQQWARFTFIEGDIRTLADCQRACAGADFVLHHAALGSVPRSISDPITTNETNINGFLNMLVAARDQAVSRMIYAASSSTYGDHPGLPKVEETIGNPLSPYAVTKYVNELYASVFARTYGSSTIGLRYFNVFGARQDPSGAYAAVIPKWVNAMLEGADITINGTGETSRDFCYVENVLQANVLAALAPAEVADQVYNVALNDRTSLLQLFELIRTILLDHGVDYRKPALHREFRQGDVLHSQASITKARDAFGYDPQFSIEKGLRAAIPWYLNHAPRL